MKKLLLGLLICLCLTSCDFAKERVEKSDTINFSTDLAVKEIRGHDYIILTTGLGLERGGCCIIHAESCKCKDN